jgi:hypothetical protein
MSTIQNQEYSNWIVSLKSSIKQRQIKAAIAVNSNLIVMHWDLGKQIVDKQENAKRGIGFIDEVSKDLKSDFMDIKGFSRSNIFAIKKLYLFFRTNFLVIQDIDSVIENKAKSDLLSESEIVHQLGRQYEGAFLKCFQISWRHNSTIIEKIKNLKEAH